MPELAGQPPEDAMLIERSWRDPEAFAALYDRHAALLHRYVARRLGNGAADDIVADTFLDAFRRRHRYDLSMSDARPWLYGIAANLIGKHSRAEVRMLRAYARTGARQGAILLPATAAAAIVVVAAGAAGYALSTSSGLAATREAPATSPAHAALAARVLHEASSVVGGAPAMAAPSPGQWIYAKSVQYQYPQGTSSYGEWITFDGSKTAYYQDGQLIVHASGGSAGRAKTGAPLAAFNADATPQTAYDALASLPTDPQALLKVTGRAADAFGAANLAAGTPVASATPKTKAQLKFDYLSLLLWNAAGGAGAPPAAEAAAFRAMAMLPGITVQRGITDAVGAPAIGISADGGYDQLLLDPYTYLVIGLRHLSTGVSPSTRPVPPAAAERITKLPKALRLKIQQEEKQRAATSWPRKGAVVYSLALAQVGEVSGPGIR